MKTIINFLANYSTSLLVESRLLGYLRQEGYVFARVCLSVCLCVSKITQKVMEGSF